MAELKITKVMVSGHEIEVTPPQAGVSSALFYCRVCKSGFFKGAVRGQYSNPHPCPALEEIWNELRPKWRRRLDQILDRYYYARYQLKTAIWRLGHGR